jgi:hypothetical protein
VERASGIENIGDETASWQCGMAATLALISRRTWRGKTHSSDGGRKAYLNFELKDAHPSRLLPRWAFTMSKSDKSDFDWCAASGGLDP